MKMNEIVTKINNKAGRTGLLVKKHSPELLMGVGVASFVWTVILACKETTRAEEIIDLHKRRIEYAKTAADIVNDGDDPLNKDYDLRKEKVIVYSHTAVSFAKLYAPAAATGALSMACFFKAYNIVNTRYLGAVAAYNAVSSAFEAYRKRVRDEIGVDADRHFRYGTKYEQIESEVITEDGKKKKTKESVEVIDGAEVSEYARFFDQSCAEWDPNPMFNMRWLRANETAANDILTSRGHIFLNEVYDMIGLPHTPEGAVVGWVKGEGDGFVDFGLNKQDDKTRRFVNGDESIVLLDFNVDGIIFDKI